MARRERHASSWRPSRHRLSLPFHCPPSRKNAPDSHKATFQPSSFVTCLLDVNAWENSTGPPHIITILLAKELAHHVFLARCANKIHEGKRHESGPSGKPVLQEQSLPETEKQDGGIHGMPNRAVNSMLYQLVAFA